MEVRITTLHVPFGRDLCDSTGARMAESQVDVDSGTLVLKAVPTTVSDKASIHYLRYAAIWLSLNRIRRFAYLL